MARPNVDVVVPFRGSESALAALCTRLQNLSLGLGDSVLVVDNSPWGWNRSDQAVPVMSASQRATPGFARNAGAQRGTAEWLVFLDADTSAVPELLDLYFAPPPGSRTGLVGGGVVDEPVGVDAPIAARYSYLRGLMSQDVTFAFGEQWGYPKTANVACRREAFEAIGGFREEIRAAEDADLAYRLRAAGWAVERREQASVVHLNRTSFRGLIVQQALWGAGGGWVHATHAAALPSAGAGGTAKQVVRTMRRVGWAVRKRDRDALILALLRPIEALAWGFGCRVMTNERPISESSRWRWIGLWR